MGVRHRMSDPRVVLGRVRHRMSDPRVALGRVRQRMSTSEGRGRSARTARGEAVYSPRENQSQEGRRKRKNQCRGVTQRKNRCRVGIASTGLCDSGDA
eukprot:132227-Pyramimonas_sp.AAC.1